MSTERRMLLQGSILAFAGILTKLIGFAYRIPMANLLGNVGNGIYSVAFGIYNIALTLSSLSMPLAVSKLVSSRLAKNEAKNARRAFWDTLLFAAAAGGVAALVLWFGADALEGVYKEPGLAKPLRILSPTTFVVAFLGTFRGWFQGHGNMVPTAVSQVLEQIVNAVVSVLAAWQLTRVFAADVAVDAYGAAGGTIGTLAGAAVGLAFVVTLFFRSREPEGLQEAPAEDHALIYRALILTVIPVVLSQTIYQIGYTLDDLIFANVMASKGFLKEEYQALQGVFNTQYNQLVNLPVSIASAMAASTVPGIVSASVRRDRRESHRKITAVLKLNMAVAIPSAVGLAVLARPIMDLLFTSLGEKEALAAHLLQAGSSAAVFYALSTITTAILQASDYMGLPVRHCAVSLAIHAALVYLLLRFTNWGVYALIVGNVTFPLLVSLLNCRALSRELRYRFKPGRTFAVPLVSALAMGVVTWCSSALLHLIGCPRVLTLIAAIVLSVAAYGYLLLRLHCFADRQLLELPMGGKLLRLSKRLER
ncbi:polysaccharide biosynthesis protein [Oscillibacter hominis]|uniref:Polysaccharide biosynthesis protein n=1 Tax=Oscillibacter hominis TaxID=2763056 RepID=A0A7G9B1Z5_9FIRM|nr:polysaccharide biosynthesis protein [Oscillibacter hominis]QNL43576.1 polysaccharide biosynthesis protein [Oscillibacter hominis]